MKNDDKSFAFELTTHTKEELKIIAESHGFKKISTYNKTQLIELIMSDQFVNNEKCYNRLLIAHPDFIRDLSVLLSQGERIHSSQLKYKKNDVLLFVDDFLETDVIGLKEVDEKTIKYYVYTDFKEPLKAILNNDFIKLNKKIHRIGSILSALVGLYGTLSYEEADALIKEYYSIKLPTSGKVYDSIMSRDFSEKHNVFLTKDIICSLFILQKSDLSNVYDKIKSIEKNQESYERYKPIKKILDLYVEKKYRIVSIEAKQFANFIEKNGVHQSELNDVIRLLMLEHQEGISVDICLDILAESDFDLKDEQAFQEFLPLLMHFLNSIRLWDFNGHTPIEVRKIKTSAQYQNLKLLN